MKITNNSITKAKIALLSKEECERIGLTQALQAGKIELERRKNMSWVMRFIKQF